MIDILADFTQSQIALAYIAAMLVKCAHYTWKELR